MFGCYWGIDGGLRTLEDARPSGSFAQTGSGLLSRRGPTDKEDHSIHSRIFLFLCLVLAASCGGDGQSTEPQPSSATVDATETTVVGADMAEQKTAQDESTDVGVETETEQADPARQSQVREEDPAEPKNVAQQGHPCIPPAAASQEPSGTVVYVLNSLGSQDWLAPSTGFQSASVLMAMNEFLLCRDHRSGLVADGVGQLAETWSVSEDWSTYTFNLRRGVQFHGGWGELTSADVKFSFELALEDQSRNYCKTVLGFVGSIETPDDYTVILHLDTPSSYLPEQCLTERGPALPIVSKNYVETAGREEASRNPIGTGPFQYTDSELDVHVTFEAVDNHWRVNPGVEKLVIRNVEEESTRVAMLDTGAAQIAPTSFDRIAHIEEDPDLALFALPGIRMAVVYLPGMYLEPQYDPEDTPVWVTGDAESSYKVRKALSLAINRQEIVDQVFSGRGTAEGLCVQSFWPVNQGYNDGCRPDPYDPDQARKLLAEAGYDDPTQMAITIDLAEHPTVTNTDEVMLAVAQYWQELGIQIETQKTEIRTYQNLTGEKRAVAAFVFPTALYHNPCALLSFYTRSTDRWSMTGETVELDQLLTDCVKEVKPAGIEVTARAVFDYMYENQLGIPVAYFDQLLAFSSSLEWDALPAPQTLYMIRYEYLRYKPN